jgi:hypothetical protein
MPASTLSRDRGRAARFHPVPTFTALERASGVGHKDRFPPPKSSVGCRFKKATMARMRRNGRDRSAYWFVTRLVMHWPSVLASGNPLRKCQRCVRPCRKDAGRDLCGRRNGVFLGFQDQAGRAVRTVNSRNGTRPLARRRSERMRAQSSFRRAWSFSSRAWPYGWHDRRAGSRPPSLLLFIARPLHRASVHGNPSFAYYNPCT